MMVYVMTKKLSEGVEQYIGIASSRKIAESSFREDYPDLTRVEQYGSTYTATKSDESVTLFIRGIAV